LFAVVELKKAKDSPASLVVMRGPSIGARFILSNESNEIGRDPAVQISLSDQSVSRKHARINRVDDKYVLTDLNSANGTWCNESKLAANESVALEKDAMIKLGNCLLKFAEGHEGHFLGSLGSAARTDSLLKVQYS
jgi:pSer/pThr/pTyr-binding forkhead associated (FHA) protein